jgi:hypothetical protein
VNPIHVGLGAIERELEILARGGEHIVVFVIKRQHRVDWQGVADVVFVGVWSVRRVAQREGVHKPLVEQHLVFLCVARRKLGIELFEENEAVALQGTFIDETLFALRLGVYGERQHRQYQYDESKSFHNCNHFKIFCKINALLRIKQKTIHFFANNVKFA